MRRNERSVCGFWIDWKIVCCLVAYVAFEKCSRRTSSLLAEFALGSALRKYHRRVIVNCN